MSTNKWMAALCSASTDTIEKIGANRLRNRSISYSSVPEPIINKKECRKAYEVLGYEPSKEKIKRSFGLNENDYIRARLEVFEIGEHEIRRKRRLEERLNKRKNRKAFQTLGIDDLKGRKTLGLEPEEKAFPLPMEMDATFSELGNLD